MQNPESDQLNLDTLPPDIIREIICVGLESFDTMRMISRQWNELALEHLSHRDRLPAIKTFHWENASKYWAMAFKVSRQYQDYFGVDSWPKRCEKSPEIAYVAEDLFKSTVEKEKWLTGRLTRLFARCSRIDKVDMKISTRRIPSRWLGTILESEYSNDEKDIINQSLCGIRIGELHFTIAGGRVVYDVSEYTSGMLDLMRANTVQAMTFHLPEHIHWGSEKTDFIDFLTEATRLVAAVELHVADKLSRPVGWEARVDEMTSNGQFSARIVREKNDDFHVLVRIIIQRNENAD